MNKITKKLVFAATFAVASLVILNLQVKSVSAAVVDLKSYYPNPQLFENYYLEGLNSRDPNSAPTRSVLWFEVTGDNGDSFKLYNSGPEDVQKRCNWDQLSWVGDNLTYTQTHSECNGDNKDVIYPNQIRLLPRYWDDSAPWSYSGSSSVTTTKLNGDPGCTGTNSYTAEVLGYVEIQPGIQAIHWRSTQAIEWATGDDAPYCTADSSTNWVENYYMIPSLPVENYQGLTSAPGLLRTVGGNSDTFTNDGLWDWDITFSRWTLLPWGVPQAVAAPIPGVPSAGSGNDSMRNVLLSLLLIIPLAALIYQRRVRTRSR